MKVRSTDLTVSTKYGKFTLRSGDLALIEARRVHAGSFRRAGNARSHVMVLTDLKKEIAERLDVDLDTAYHILAEVKTVDLYERTGRPAHLDLAVRWEQGWKTYQVTGTRHAYYLLRKLAQKDGFDGARLNDPLVAPDGTRTDNVIYFFPEDITGSDAHGVYAALLDRNNAHYDLEA